MILPAIFLGLVAASLGQDVITFSEDEEVGREEEEQETCLTLSGQQCQFPFIFRGLARTGCIRDSDPAGLLWCSTLLDSQASVLHSHWLSSYITVLSLVQRISVLLATALLCHKEPAPVFACSSLVFYDIRIVGFQAQKGPNIGTPCWFFMA